MHGARARALSAVLPVTTMSAPISRALTIGPINEGKSLASFCCHLAWWFPDMFGKFYLTKNHKNAKNSATIRARENISTYLGSLEFLDVCLTKFINNQILFTKISHRFLLTTKLFTRWTRVNIYSYSLLFLKYEKTTCWFQQVYYWWLFINVQNDTTIYKHIYI